MLGVTAEDGEAPNSAGEMGVSFSAESPRGREQAVPLPGVNSTSEGPCSGPPVLTAEPAASQMSGEDKVSPALRVTRSCRRRRRGTKVSALPLPPDPVFLKVFNEVQHDELNGEQQGDEELSPCFAKVF